MGTRTMAMGGFISGLLTGIATAAAGALALLTLVPEPITLRLPPLEPLWEWTRLNLGLSLPVFAALLLLYARDLRRLERTLEGNDAAPEQVAQVEQRLEVWTSLFFGTGVIWTAIGMRSALIEALGEPGAVGADAAEVLQRLVDGGILLALSTTIFGGVGGYLLRVIKLLSVGARLRRFYEGSARVHADRVEGLLGEIRRALEQRPEAAPPRERSGP